MQKAGIFWMVLLAGFWLRSTGLDAQTLRLPPPGWNRSGIPLIEPAGPSDGALLWQQPELPPRFYERTPGMSAVPLRPSLPKDGLYQAPLTYLGCATGLRKIKFMGIPVPLSYGVEGGGAYCEGESSGVAVRLSGSQAGIVYRLEREGYGVVAERQGDGGGLDFGILAAPGHYTVLAVDPESGCERRMEGAAEVVMGRAPQVRAGSDTTLFDEHALLALGGARPAGGQWSGPGAEGPYVNPGAMGRGDHVLRYTCSDEYGCTATGERRIKVVEPPLLTAEGSTQLGRGQTVRLRLQRGYDDYRWWRDGQLLGGEQGAELIVWEAGTYRAEVFASGSRAQSNELTVYTALQTDPGYNRVWTRTLLTAGVDSAAQAEALPPALAPVQVNYMDGLGRGLQQVETGLDAGGYDLITASALDGMGRDTVSYLAWGVRAGGGGYRRDAAREVADFYAYPPRGVATGREPWSRRVLEGSALGRLLEEGAPGEAWQPGGGHSTRHAHDVNAAGEVRRWGLTGDYPEARGHWPAGSLKKLRTTDGQGRQAEEYRDGRDQIVLQRRHAGGGRTADTYYVYDVYGNLRVVLPPQASEDYDRHFTSDPRGFMLHRAYMYRYDARRRMVEKKLPGAGWVHMVYDGRDRLVLSQDSAQRVLGRWLFTKYDELNRPVITGFYEDGRARQALQKELDGRLKDGRSSWGEQRAAGGYGYGNRAFPAIREQDVLSVQFYDDYGCIADLPARFGSAFRFDGALLPDVPESPLSDNGIQAEGPADRPQALATAKGRITGGLQWLEGTGQWLAYAVYYDRRYRELQRIASNHSGGLDIVSSAWDFGGRLSARRHLHRYGAAGAEVQEQLIGERFAWDGAGRLLEHHHHLAHRIAWQPKEGLGRSGERWVKTAIDGWNARALSVSSIAPGQNGWAELELERYAEGAAIGLLGGKESYVLRVAPGGLLRVVENGVELPLPGKAHRGDRLVVERRAGVIRYRLNGRLLYTSRNLSTEALRAGQQLYYLGDGLQEGWLSPSGEVLLVRQVYNAVGQLSSKRLHSADGGASFAQQLDYAYHLRGWLTRCQRSGKRRAAAGADNSAGLLQLRPGIRSPHCCGRSTPVRGRRIGHAHPSPALPAACLLRLVLRLRPPGPAQGSRARARGSGAAGRGRDAGVRPRRQHHRAGAARRHRPADRLAGLQLRYGGAAGQPPAGRRRQRR
jgi:YD repeat-containing protein